MGQRKSILFIGHDASLTGAPILLLNLISLLKRENDLRVTLLLVRGGVLEDEYKKAAQTFIYRNNWFSKDRGYIFKVLVLPFLLLRKFYCLYLAFRADIIFSNTIANGRLLKFLSITKKPVVVYVHELATVFSYFERLKDSSSSISHGKFIVYPSMAVRTFLNEKFKIADSKLKYLRYFYPSSNFDSVESRRPILKEEFLRKFDIPTNRFLVVGMGVAGQRKGTDIFLEVCKLLKTKSIFFVWIGGFESDNTRDSIVSYIESNRLEDSVKFVGSQPFNPLALSPFDLLFLSSREDPYPLVVIEGAYNCVPTVCFSGSGGIVEFVRDCGWVLDSDSVELASAKINELSLRRDEVTKAGQLARETALTRHSSPEKVLSEFYSIINEI